MKLLLIRHGESQADILILHEGRADFSLTDCGVAEAEAMAAYVKSSFQINRIYSSPLRRAAQTAEILSEAINVPVEKLDDLMEFNNGLIAGFTHEEADLRFPKIDIKENEASYEMESLVEFRNRIEKVYEKIISENGDDDTVAVVTHGGVINQFYRSVLQLPVNGNVAFPTSDTGIHVWLKKGNNVRIIKANIDEHITPEISSMAAHSVNHNVSYFAGGCFWCITPVFKMYGAKKCLCGYSGGNEVNPSYEQVKKQQTGHRETIAVEYDPCKVNYEKLMDIFLANVDPYDKEGQFIDKGFSYTLAVYYTSEEEKEIALKKIHELEVKSGKKVFIAVEKFINFYEAETYHQDYYLKNPEAFEKELIESGRKKPL